MEINFSVNHMARRGIDRSPGPAQLGLGGLMTGKAPNVDDRQMGIL